MQGDSTLPSRAQDLLLTTNAPAHPHERFTLLFCGVPDQILIHNNFAFGKLNDDRASSIVESADALTSPHRCTWLVDTSYVLDRPYQHRTDGNDSDW